MFKEIVKYFNLQDSKLILVTFFAKLQEHYTPIVEIIYYKTQTVKRHDDWKSSQITKRYIEYPINKKNKTQLLNP